MGPGTVLYVVAVQRGRHSSGDENHSVWPVLDVYVCCGAPPTVGWPSCASIDATATSTAQLQIHHFSQNSFPRDVHIPLPLHELSHSLLKGSLRPAEQWTFGSHCCCRIVDETTGPTVIKCCAPPPMCRCRMQC